MDWSAISAIGTAATALVVAVTALFGFHQLKLTRIQLEQLRRATQLEGAVKIFDYLSSPSYLEARHFVATQLAASLEDPVFRQEVQLGVIWTQNMSTVHHEVAWEHLSPVVEIHRSVVHPRMWENFERLHEAAKAWFLKRGGRDRFDGWRERLARYERRGPTA
ncbi:MAG TPA: hypothetical protein VFF63_01915 [Candidatus Babeliales bacterium]|nr:hypothetical protein [Candidatus Babeliales bacterium]